MSTQSPAGGRPILSQQDLVNHQVGTSGTDIIWSPLFDWQAYSSSGIGSGGLSFFQAQIGQGTTSAPGGGTGAKTIFDTNMTLPGQLGLGNEFYVIGSETEFMPGVTNSTTTPFGLYPGVALTTPANTGLFVNDLWNVGNQGFKRFAVGTDRNYIQDGPLINFPPTVGLEICAALAEIGPSSTSTGTGLQIAYARFCGEPYTIAPVYIQSTQPFTMAYTFAATVALPSGVNGRIGERLRGYLIRQVT
jgi:hypothetical protein